MDIGFNLSGNRTQQTALNRLPNEVGEKVRLEALKTAVKPMAARVVAEAPRGKGNLRVSLSRNRGRSNNYRRAGATKEDVRIKAVSDKLGEAKVLVGVSKKSGKVGWRTHFITQGVAGKHRIAPNDFLTRAFNATIAGVRATYSAILERKLKAALRRIGFK